MSDSVTELLVEREKPPFKCKRPNCEEPWDGGYTLLCSRHAEEEYDFFRDDPYVDEDMRESDREIVL